MKIPPGILEQVKEYYLDGYGVTVDYEGLVWNKNHKSNFHKFMLKKDYEECFVWQIIEIDDLLLSCLHDNLDLYRFIISELNIGKESMETTAEAQ